MASDQTKALALLFNRLAERFDGDAPIERHARAHLLDANVDYDFPAKTPDGLAVPFLDAMSRSDADPICSLITALPFAWAPPQTSSDPLYSAHSTFKVHVELLGPDGLVRSDTIRLGLYGILPNSEYGLRTHPAEETYIMLAGRADWMRGAAPYRSHGPGERSYHPSMLPHATRTQDQAFMSVYTWCGDDISTTNYHYTGLPVQDQRP
jgi:hypothetical protein